MSNDLLNPGFSLTLRPMRYPKFFELYKTAVANTWSINEVDFSSDLKDLNSKITKGEHHLIQRLVAFFATGDTIVSNNLVLSLYKHINSPEARMFLSRQMFEEAQHIHFYLTLLDTYIPDLAQREMAFKAVSSIPSIKKKADFCKKWTDPMLGISQLDTEDSRKQFLLNLMSYAGAVEGLFFFSAFAYVYYLRSRGLLNGLASGTNWVFRDESLHLKFGVEVIKTVREECPELFGRSLEIAVYQMMDEAVRDEIAFAEDLLSEGVVGLTLKDMSQYIKYTADTRLTQLGYNQKYKVRNPFSFMELQDVPELTNFFERPVTAYRTDISGSVRFDEDF